MTSVRVQLDELEDENDIELELTVDHDLEEQPSSTNITPSSSVELSQSQSELLLIPNKPPTQKQEQPFPYQWMFLALLAHAGWGIYPVLARYLQIVSNLPTMSLMMTGNGAVSLISFYFVLRRKKFLKILRKKMLPIVIIVTVIRASTNLISPKFTMAIYVQLMTLMSPFLVALFNTLFMKEDLPPFTIPAMICTFLGSSLMLFSSVFPFQLTITTDDWIGISLAFVSACFLAIYMLLVKKATSDVAGEELLFFLTAPLVIVACFFSFLLNEDWTPWTYLDLHGWLIFGVFSLGILMMGNLLQISSIRWLGAPMVSTLLAFRLVSSCVFSAIIMNEQLTDIFQLIGAVMVLASVTAYMWVQYRSKKKSSSSPTSPPTSPSILKQTASTTTFLR